MRVLINLGYQSKVLNPTIIETGGLGGTERAGLHIAKGLRNFGWKVVVTGYVEDDQHEGVEWLHLDRVHDQYHDQFDIIISASYIHSIVEFKDYSAKQIFWAHNTDFFPWYRGQELPNAETILHEFDHTVCLTQWHKAMWINKYGVDPSRVTVIGNGLDTSTFYGHPPKVKDRFIWSSAPDRGLDQLLDHWHQIKAVKPGATLHVYAPSYSKLSSTKDLEGVTFHGTVSQDKLHRAMLEAEYWCYITDYEETYCITALEMQYANVLPIVTSTAALDETVHSGLVLDRSETVWQDMIQVLTRLDSGIVNKSLRASREWARMQTWNSRAHDWKRLIQTI